VLDVPIVGDDEAVATVGRPQVHALLSDRAPNDKLAGFAPLQGDVVARTTPVHRILADAARSDEDAASLLAEIALQRQAGQHRVARSLAMRGVSVVGVGLGAATNRLPVLHAVSAIPSASAISAVKRASSRRRRSVFVVSRTVRSRSPWSGRLTAW
jgi:hypothetical protein